MTRRRVACPRRPTWRSRASSEFKETTQARERAGHPFRDVLMCEEVEHVLSGDVKSGKVVQRDYIKATGGFEQLEATTGASAKSLIRMFGPRANPQARNLFALTSNLQRKAGLTLHATAQSQ